MIPENGRFSRFEPRKRGSEPRFRGSKRAGISRVKILVKYREKNSKKEHKLNFEVE